MHEGDSNEEGKKFVGVKIPVGKGNPLTWVLIGHKREKDREIRNDLSLSFLELGGSIQ